MVIGFINRTNTINMWHSTHNKLIYVLIRSTQTNINYIFYNNNNTLVKWKKRSFARTFDNKGRMKREDKKWHVKFWNRQFFYLNFLNITIFGLFRFPSAVFLEKYITDSMASGSCGTPDLKLCKPKLLQFKPKDLNSLKSNFSRSSIR